MYTYIITRYFERTKEKYVFETSMKEMDQYLGEFVAIYSIGGCVNVQNGRMDALDDKGNFLTSIAWTIKD